MKGEKRKKLQAVTYGTVPPQCPDMTWGQQAWNMAALNHPEEFRRLEVTR